MSSHENPGEAHESQDALRREEDAKHHPFERGDDHDHGPEGHSREECEHPEHDHHHG